MPQDTSITDTKAERMEMFRIDLFIHVAAMNEELIEKYPDLIEEILGVSPGSPIPTPKMFQMTSSNPLVCQKCMKEQNTIYLSSQWKIKTDELLLCENCFDGVLIK